MIFVDSSYFIAVARKKDQWHERAKEIYDKLDEELLVSDLVVSESVTSVGAISGGKEGRVVYDYILDNCHIVYADKKMMDRAMEVYLTYDGILSLADAVSLVVMEDHSVRRILSFDSDYDKVKNIARIA